MKSDSAALPAFLAKTGASASAQSASAGARKQDNGGDDFASVMRKNASTDTGEKSASKNENAARDGASRTGREQMQANAQARAQARADTRDRRPGNAQDKGDVETAAHDAAAAQTAAGKPGTKRADAASDSDTAADTHDALPLDWPPAGLMLPSLLESAGSVLASAAGAAGDVLLGGATSALTGGVAGGALPGLLSTGVRGLGLATTDATNLANAPGAAAADGLPSGDANSTAGGTTNSNTADGTTAGRAGALTLPGLATTTTAAALPATAALPTPSDAAQRLPMGLAQFKDALEGALGGKRDELPAAAAAFALTGTTAPSDNGLARTATVNPLTALTPDVNTDQFGETIGTQLTYMAHEKISHAHIKVSPNDMGTIEVSLKLDGDRVHADFSSPQADVRQALEQSLPKLREMLGQQGFQLAQADVGHRQQQQAQPSGSQGFGERGGQGGREGLAGNGQGDATAPAAVVRVARGLVDAYA